MDCAGLTRSASAHIVGNVTGSNPGPTTSHNNRSSKIVPTAAIAGVQHKYLKQRKCLGQQHAQTTIIHTVMTVFQTEAVQLKGCLRVDNKDNSIHL